MKIKKLINWLLLGTLFFMLTGFGVFFHNASNAYTINNDFTSVPLQFDPDDSSSSHQLADATVTIYGGFVKGIQKEKDGTKSLVLRALSPLPKITVAGNQAETLTLRLENINPDSYGQSIATNEVQAAKISPNTLKITVTTTGETTTLTPPQPTEAGNGRKNNYVIMGDSRNGYDTFEQMIQQINGLKPAFVIDNGDLVFSGKPNQYRLFDQVVSQLDTTLITSLGNHDIRGDGRDTYTALYGPPYYSFDYDDNHFIVLDSAEGWAGEQAISMNSMRGWNAIYKRHKASRFSSSRMFRRMTRVKT